MEEVIVKIEEEDNDWALSPSSVKETNGTYVSCLIIIIILRSRSERPRSETNNSPLSTARDQP